MDEDSDYQESPYSLDSNTYSTEKEAMSTGNLKSLLDEVRTGTPPDLKNDSKLPRLYLKNPQKIPSKKLLRDPRISISQNKNKIFKTDQRSPEEAFLL